MPRSTKEQRARLLELARRFHELMQQWEAAHPYDTFKIDPKLSRILALVPEYDSGRVRKAAPVPCETVQKQAYDCAAGADGIDGDFAPEPHEVFRGIHGIGGERLQVVRVTSDSMSPLLLTGDRVLIDTSRTRPREGDVVGVVSERHGRLIGYWHVEQKRCFLKKENRD